MWYEVTVVAKVRVNAEGYDAAAKLAEGIVKGTVGRPDSSKIEDVHPTTIATL